MQAPMNDRDTIRRFIIANFLFGDGHALKDDTLFLESGVIDSTGLLEVILFIETTFGISVQDHELLPDNLNSIDNLVRFIAAKKSA